MNDEQVARMTETPMTKARAALAAAKGLIDGAELDRGLLPLAKAEEFARLMRVAEIQVMMAMADTLERISTRLDHSH